MFSGTSEAPEETMGRAPHPGPRRHTVAVRAELTAPEISEGG